MPDPEPPPGERTPGEPGPPRDHRGGWGAEDLAADDLSRDSEPESTPPPDPVGVVAVGLGFLGIVFFGIVLSLVVGILGAFAGQRAREDGRSFELAYLAFLLSAVDGVVWIAMQLLFEVPLYIG